MPEGNVLEQIRSLGDNARNLAMLVEQVRGRGVVPLLGAGVSVPFKFQTWSGFLLDLARRVDAHAEIEGLLREGKYEEACERVARARGWGAFEDDVKEAFGPERLEGATFAGTAAGVLPRLAQGPVLTTNLDDVTERAFAWAGVPFGTVVTGANLGLAGEAVQSGSRILFKLHGGWRDARDRVLTLQEYREKYGADDAAGIDWTKPLPRVLRLLFAGGAPLLAVGCSLQVDRTLLALAAANEDRNLRHYAILAAPADPEALRKHARALSELGFRPIFYPADRHELLPAILAAIADEAGRPALPVAPATVVAPSHPSRRLRGPDDPLLASPRPFHGREKEVAQVREAMEGGAGLTTVIAIRLLEGGPGVGKTEICHEALRRHLRDHPDAVVYYVGLAGAASAPAVLARLAEAFGRPEVDSLPKLLPVIHAAPGIVYLDNLEDALVAEREPTVALLRDLARVLGRPIFASSRQGLPGLARNVAVEELPPDVAFRVFQDAWQEAKGATLEDTPALREFLVQDLGCHALALVLVASRAEEFPSWQSLRDEWRATSRNLKLATLPGFEDTREKSYSLYVSIEGTFRAVCQRSPAAVQLWGALAFFPEGLPEEALPHLRLGENVDVREAVGVLVHLNVARWVDRRLRAPPVLQRYARAKAAQGACGLSDETMAHAAYPWFLHVAQEADAHTFDQAREATLTRLLESFPDLERFIHHAAALDTTSPPLAPFVHHLRNFLGRRIFPGLAISRALERVTRERGDERTLALACLSLGDLERHLGDLGRARVLYGEVEKLYRKVQSDLGLANTLKALGDLERRLGDLGRARVLYGEAEKLYRKEQDDLGLANTLQALGDLERHLGELERAMVLYGEAERLYRKEQSSLGLAYVLCELARVAHAQGESLAAAQRLAEAEGAARKSGAPHAAAYVEATKQEIFGGP